ncbi:Uncharacterized protein TCM_010830 [Theobroma cacao]|uniref:DUF7745 domain-containing protein n=1 Tax=Theobroma cacao TaxID=3641 RepID=A0A061EF55_THECC|nr:Uncharacterized protein TCM_010830 [Theobroma cacao]
MESSWPPSSYDRIYEVTQHMVSAQQSERDCLAKDHISLLPERVHPDIKHNDFTDLLDIWERRKLAKMMGITPREVDQNLRKKGDNECIPWSFLRSYIMMHRDIEQGQLLMTLGIYGLVIFSKVLEHIEVEIIDFFEQVINKANLSPSILAEILRSLNYCRRNGEGRFVGCTQLLSIWIVSHFECKVKRFKKPFHPQSAPIIEFYESEWPENKTTEQWISKFQKLMRVEVTWRAPWMPCRLVLYKYEDEPWVPIMGPWGVINYAPIMVRRQFGSEQFVPMTHRLNTLEFAYGKPSFLKRIEGIAQAWKKTS